MISGFTIVRNAKLLDYPFKESVRSLLQICDEVVINCGDSSDGTLGLCLELGRESSGRIRIIQSVWSKENQAGGFQLKHQSDKALAECTGDWCIYLQADEVLHESDNTKILSAIAGASADPKVDGILFDYLHFYGNYAHQISGRNWYRREVRAFKNHRGIESYRDAQGFRKNGEKLLVKRSSARVFHYGYVRTSESLQKKSKEMGQWWGNTPDPRVEDYALHRHVGLRRFAKSHPRVMVDRLARNAEYVDPSQCTRKWDRNEIKNAVTFLWESIVPIRLGEFTNYELARKAKPSRS